MAAVRILPMVALMMTISLGGLGFDDRAMAQQAGQAASDSETLVVWDINIGRKTDQDKFDWREFPERITDGTVYDRKPDIILVQDLPFDAGVCHSNPTAANCAKQFVKALETDLGDGTQYGWEHASSGSGTTGGNMVMWRKGRFSLLDIHRWSVLGGSSCEPTYEGHRQPAKVIAARLRDTARDETFVATSTHWPTKINNNCILKNVKKTERELDSQWKVRRITIMGSDFNERPDQKQEGDTREEWRMEQDPDCWYREVSASRGDDPTYPWEPRDCSGARTTLPPSMSYYDAVWVDQYAEDDDGDGIYDICQHWSHFNVAGPDSCSDSSHGAGRKRIDYIWVRYEDASGGWQSQCNRPSTLIPNAGSDRGYSDGRRYSNHRGVQAILKWGNEPNCA